MTAEEYKKRALMLLNLCLAEAITTGNEDDLNEEEQEKHEAYLEGFEDAIKKIESLETN